MRRGTKSMQTPKFSEAFPGAIIREGADELTLRAEEVGMQRAFIDTKDIELERWGPPLVDGDWDAFSQSIHKGLEGDEREELYYHYRELNQEQQQTAQTTTTPLWGVESCSPPSRRPNPIPVIPPCVVRTPHLHVAPTAEETSFVKP